MFTFELSDCQETLAKESYRSFWKLKSKFSYYWFEIMLWLTLRQYDVIGRDG